MLDQSLRMKKMRVSAPVVKGRCTGSTVQTCIERDVKK